MVTIVITEKCNLKCGYCIYDQKTSNTITKDIIDDIFRKEPEDNFSSIFLFGGEPTIATDIIDYICNKYMELELEDRCVSIPTNLVNLNNLDKIIDKYKDIYFSLLVGFEGINDTTAKAKFGEKIIYNVGVLKDKPNCGIEIAYVLTEENVHKLKELEKHFGSDHSISVAMRFQYKFDYSDVFIDTLIDQLIDLEKENRINLTPFDIVAGKCGGAKSYSTTGKVHQCHHYALNNVDKDVIPLDSVSLAGYDCIGCECSCSACPVEAIIDNDLILVPKNFCIGHKILNQYTNTRFRAGGITKEDLEVYKR